MAPNAFELPQVGSTFADQFEVLELIGQGGMGVVFRARQLKLQREVALKVLRPSAVADGYEQFRLQREAVSAARFRSQHVVDIYDWGVSADGLTYLVMELLHGETLAERLERQGVIEPGQVAGWLRQCGEALDEAAALGVVHRDIKPANLFLATTPNAGTIELKVLDFGITKVFDANRATFHTEATTQSNLRMGTTRYMSPEQLRTSSVDARADIWSLGVVIYQALSGRCPFDQASEADLIVSILSDEPTPLHLVNAKLSRAMADAVARALEKNADSRYRSAGEFSRALAAALDRQRADLLAEAPDSRRPALLPATPFARAGEATIAGLETRASNDSLHTERKPRQLRTTKVLAVAGVSFALSSGLAIAAISLFPGSAPTGAGPAAAATLPQQARHDEGQKLSVHIASPALANASVAPPVKSVTQLPLSKVGAGVAKPRLLAPETPIRTSASAARSAPAARSADQFERDNPYAN